MKWVNLLFGLVFSFSFPVPALASVISKIVFTTDPQSIAPSNLSDAITVQVQDSSGQPVETPETLDLVFTSTSPSGEFLGSTGNAVSKTMSKSTANRTFYYRDPTEGTFTLKVAATGRDSGLSWNASQTIFISKNSPISTTNSSSKSSNTSSVQSSNLSATSGPVPISKTTIDPSFEIYVGDDRLTTAGSPIVFKALVRKSDSSLKTDFSWSFGDGSVGGGAEPIHTYKYAGTYAVVVNAKCGSNSALSRLAVRVSDPKLNLLLDSDSVEIANESDDEINLFNWKLVGGAKNFIFQPDTIILPKSSVRFDSELLGFNPNSFGEDTLFDSVGRKVASSLDVIEVPSAEGSSTELVSPAEIESETIQDQSSAVVLSQSQQEPKTISSTSSKVIIYEAPQNKTKSWWRKIFDFFTGNV